MLGRMIPQTFGTWELLRTDSTYEGCHLQYRLVLKAQYIQRRRCKIMFRQAVPFEMRWNVCLQTVVSAEFFGTNLK